MVISAGPVRDGLSALLNSACLSISTISAAAAAAGPKIMKIG
jgi:hypothetical protein